MKQVKLTNYWRVYYVKSLMYYIEQEDNKAMNELQKAMGKKKLLIINWFLSFIFLLSNNINERKLIIKQFENALKTIHYLWLSKQFLWRILEAIQQYLIQSKCISKDIICLSNIGSCYESLGQFETSIEYYKKSLEINLNFQILKNKLKSLNEKKKYEMNV